MTGASTHAGCWPAVVSVLGQTGTEVMFGLPADDLALLGALDRQADVRFVLCRDQRNAVFMATGYALQSGKVGVAVVGKGPAVTNTLTGLLEAGQSAAPVLLLAAGTALDRIGARAFQELDQLTLVRPMVKWAARVDHPDRLAAVLEKALVIASTGTPGPVYVEVPDHLLTTAITVGGPRQAVIDETLADPVVAGDSAAWKAIGQAERPIILVGGGVRHRNGAGLVEQFAERLGAAIFCTASGRGAVNEDHPQFCGLAGLYVPKPASTLWDEADCVISLGSRLEETATFGWPNSIGTDVPVVQVNIQAAELSYDFAGPRVVGDVGQVLRAWTASGKITRDDAPRPWLATVGSARERIIDGHRVELARLKAEPGLHIPELLHALRQVLPASLVLVQENGLQDMWSYSFPVHSCGSLGGSVVPSEQTSLGFGAAAAVGVKVAAPDRPVVAFVGDGAFELFGADLLTAVGAGIGVLYVVLRNGGYGWLEHQLRQQDPVPDGVAFVSADRVGATTPDITGLYRATVTDGSDVAEEIRRAWQHCQQGRVAVLDVPVVLRDALLAETELTGDFPTAASQEEGSQS